MLPGVCVAFGVTALGIFIVPVGLVLVICLAWRRATVDALGLLAGVGAIVAWVGSINLGYRACSSSHPGLSLAPGERSVSYSCGGVNGQAWLIVGVCMLAASVALYLVMSDQQGALPSKPTRPQAI